MTTVNIILFHNLTKCLRKSMIELFVARQMFPKNRTTINRTSFIYIFIIARKFIGLAIEHTNNHITNIYIQPIKARFIL